MSATAFQLTTSFTGPRPQAVCDKSGLAYDVFHNRMVPAARVVCLVPHKDSRPYLHSPPSSDSFHQQLRCQHSPSSVEVSNMAKGNKRPAPSSPEGQPPARRQRIGTGQGNNNTQAAAPGTASATGQGATIGLGNNANQAPQPRAPPAAVQRALHGPMPVDRRAAYPPRPARTSTPRTQAEREERITALRNQLRYPHAIARLILVGFLSGAGWDVNRAAAVFWEGHNRYSHRK